MINRVEIKPIILVVDDDPSIVELMRDFLEGEQYAVQTASDGPAALEILKKEPIDCILMDVMMPQVSGFEVCRQIRLSSEVPILFLSARDEDYDKIRGLGLGGDDYIVKSASPGEVVARIKAVLRRYHKTTDNSSTRLNFGRLVLDAKAHKVLVDGLEVPFTAREFELLYFLAEHPFQVFTREQLFQRFWGEVGDRHTVTVHIGRIRDKIEAAPEQPIFIVTVWGVGYRFEGVRE